MKIKITCPCGTVLYLTPGQIRPGHGKYCSRKCTFKYRDNSKFLSSLNKKGKENQNWKGDRVGYKAFHLRVNKIRGKAKICDFCKSTDHVEWASKTKNYSDIFDYIPLCRKCHQIFDDIHAKGWRTRKEGDVSA